MSRTSMLVAPNEPEWLQADDGFAALIADLDQLGFDARVQTPRNGNYSMGGVVVDEAVGITLFLWDRVRDETLDLIATAVVARVAYQLGLKDGAGDEMSPDSRATGKIVGPDGEVLRQFPLRPGLLSRVRRRAWRGLRRRR